MKTEEEIRKLIDNMTFVNEIRDSRDNKLALAINALKWVIGEVDHTIKINLHENQEIANFTP